MEYLIGLIALLGGGLFFYRSKAKNAGALLENEPTKKQVNEINRETEALAGRLDAEQARREDIQSSVQEETKGVDSAEDLVRFIDAYSKRKK